MIYPYMVIRGEEEAETGEELIAGDFEDEDAEYERKLI